MKTVKPVKTSNSQQQSSNSTEQQQPNKPKIAVKKPSEEPQSVTKQEQPEPIKKSHQDSSSEDNKKAKQGDQSVATTGAANTTADQIQYSADGRPKLVVSIELDLIKLISMNPSLALAEPSYYDQLSENAALQVAAHHAAASNESLLNDIVNDELKMSSKSGGVTKTKEAETSAQVELQPQQQEKKTTSSSSRSKSPSSNLAASSTKGNSSSSTANSKDRVRI